MPRRRSPVRPCPSTAAGPHIDCGHVTTTCKLRTQESSTAHRRRDMAEINDTMRTMIDRSKLPGQVVLVLQGGGALGSYQAGVYQAMHEAGLEPDWIIGTSIGAINASLIAGNAPKDRLSKLKMFWESVEQTPDLDIWSSLPWVGRSLPNWSTMANGIAGFFKPNPLAFLGMHVPLAPDAAGYYSTKPLEKTLNELVDFGRLS